MPHRTPRRSSFASPPATPPPALHFQGLRAPLPLVLLLPACNSPPAASAMLAAERARLLPVEKVLPRLAIAPGATVADLGAGPGYLTLPIGRAVARRGRVIATDVDRAALAQLRDRARAEGLANIETVVVSAGDPGLAPSTIDLALVCHVDAFLPDRAAWLARLA